MVSMCPVYMEKSAWKKIKFIVGIFCGFLIDSQTQNSFRRKKIFQNFWEKKH